MQGVMQRRSQKLGGLGLVFIVLGALLIACASSERAPDAVHVLTWQGDVNPVMARYIDRGIDAAEKSSARAVVLRLDTPGGFDSSMRDIVKRIESSKVPVVLYVWPSGGRAASAGTFIAMAAHVSAMSPSTTIGAATPINADGNDIEGALGRKVTNDAVAFIRALAQEHGRNADWAERAVREGVAANQDEALELKAVDLVAPSLEDLLKAVNGREVKVASAGGGASVATTLRTADAPIRFNDPTFFEELLYRLANPNIAFLLLTLGALALLSEILHPTFFAGVFGVIALIFAYFALGSLDTNWAGAALVVFGVVLLGSDIFIDGHGILSAGGVVAIALGGLILTGGSEPGGEVSRWLVGGVALTAGLLAVTLIAAIVQARRYGRRMETRTIVGARGVARTRLDPRGIVSVQGESWQATAEGRPIEEREPVIVTASSGLSLKVRGLQEDAAATAPEALQTR